ncbi:efflux RND transporter periplasmic adaptor subunit [soil metagenome]
MTDSTTPDSTTPDSTGKTAAELDDFLGVQPEKPWKKWAVRGGIGLILLILILLVARCFSGGDAPNYATQTVRRGDLTVTVSATGNLKPINQVDVGSEQSGIMTHVFVDVNDRVTKGQILAELDPSRLQDTVNQSRSQVAAARAGVAQAQAQAALARATLARQENVFKLSGGRVPAKTELDSARASYEQAVATVQSAQAQVQVSAAQLSSAATNLSKAKIVSPVTGVVLSRSIEPGQTVAASFNAPVLFTIAEDLKQMEVQVSVDEADVGQVADGQPATFTVDAFPGQNFPARISRVNVGSNSSTSSSSTTTTTTGTVVAYTAVLSVDNTQENLRPGMTATADIITKQLHDALLIPNAALRFNPSQASGAGGGITSTLMPRPRRGNRATQSVSFGAGSSQTVYIVGEDGKPKPITVIVGDSDGARTAITGGDLKDGMKVITGQLAAGQTAPEERGDSDRTGSGKKREGSGNAASAPAAPSANASAASATERRPGQPRRRDAGTAPADGN